MKIQFTLPLIFICLFGFSQKVDSVFVNDKIEQLNNQFQLKLNQQIDQLRKELLLNTQSIKDVQLNTDKSFKSSYDEIADLKLKFDGFNSSIKKIKSLNDKLNQSINLLTSKINSSTSKVNNFDKAINIMESYNDSIGAQVVLLNNDIQQATKEIELEHQTNESNKNMINGVSNELSKKGQYGLVIIVISIVLIFLVYVLLSKKWNKQTLEINKKQNEIFEKQIYDSQQLAEWLSKESTKELTQSDPDHAFAKRVADEIIRISTNLSRMDESIKGYKQLNASVRKLEQSLNSNHYEIENLLNKPWNSGMNLQANFVLDENLKEGESIITRVIKPQINYKGKLIQAAQVEVSQGE